jgi:hypothetical protein
MVALSAQSNVLSTHCTQALMVALQAKSFVLFHTLNTVADDGTHCQEP